MSEKKGNLLYKINKLTRGNLEELLVVYGICPLCAENENVSFLTRRRNETVCTQCGYVPEQYSHDHKVPFGFSGSPTNLLSFGKGLGGTLQEKGTFCVLAHSDAYKDNAQHLPMSAKFIKILTSKLENPKIQSLIKNGRKLCDDWGFHEHDARHVVFRNFYALMLRKIGAYLLVCNARSGFKEIAEACFCLALAQCGNTNLFVEAVRKLDVKESTLNDVTCILELQAK